MTFKNKLKITVIILMALIIQLPGITEVTVSASRKPENGGIAVPIIIYHNIRRINLSELTISPCEFENDLIYLKSNGFSTITIDDLIGYQKGTEALPKKPIVICFDDGYLNTYAYAFPLLKAYGMRAVLSIIGKDTDDFSEIDIKDLSYAHANWKQIAEMKNSGVFEIQNHSYNLHLATSKRYGCTKNHGESPSHYEKVLTDDLNKLQQEVYENTGYMPTAFTYPFGRISDESIPIIKKLGFKASLTCDYGINIITKDPEKLYGLKRIARYHNISLKKTLAEGFKTLE